MNPTRYLTCSSLGNYGRFANGAFQVAGIIGIARRNGMQPVFPVWRNYWHRDGFGSNEDIEIHAHLVNALPAIPDGLTFQQRTIEWGYHDVDLPQGNWDLSGHFQSERYFQHCLDEVRYYLTFKDEPPQNGYIAVHWRAGDYDGCDTGYHPRMTMAYYSKAMQLFPDAQFLIFSDSIEEAKQLFGNAANLNYSQGGDYLYDFKLMKRCKSFIIANSSYSALAAILGEYSGKQVVAPYPWFGKAWGDAMVANKDVYSSNWTVVDYRQ